MGFRQDECRPGASAWACCLWFVALLHVRGSWSSCVFVRSTVVAFWGAAFLSALSEQRALGCFRLNLVAPRVLPGVRAGSEARPPFSVVICWGRARRARRWGRSRLQFIVSVGWAFHIWACKRRWPIPSTLWDPRKQQGRCSFKQCDFS